MVHIARHVCLKEETPSKFSYPYRTKSYGPLKDGPHDRVFTYASESKIYFRHFTFY